MRKQLSKKRQLATVISLAFIVATTCIATLITSPVMSEAAAHDNGNQKSKDKNKPKDPKCNNVNVLLKVSKIPKGSKIVIAKATLDGQQDIAKDSQQDTTCSRC